MMEEEEEEPTCPLPGSPDPPDPPADPPADSPDRVASDPPAPTVKPPALKLRRDPEDSSDVRQDSRQSVQSGNSTHSPGEEAARSSSLTKHERPPRDSFHGLLERIDEAHTLEVTELQLEIARLRGMLGGAGVAIPPSPCQIAIEGHHAETHLGDSFHSGTASPRLAISDAFGSTTTLQARARNFSTPQYASENSNATSWRKPSGSVVRINLGTEVITKQRTSELLAAVIPGSPSSPAAMLANMDPDDLVLTLKEFALGTISVFIEGATGLRNADWGLTSGKSDPYCVCEVPGRPNFTCRTAVIQDTLDPVWNHKCIISGLQPEDTIKFTVFDEDFGSDERLGYVELPFETFENGFDGDLALLDAGEGINALLKVKIKVTLKPTSTDINDIMTPSQVAEMLEGPAELWSEWKQVPKCLHSSSRSILSRGGTIIKRAFHDGFNSLDVHRGHGDSDLTGTSRLLHPECSRRLVWDISGLFVLISDLIWLPMQVFDPPFTAPVAVYTWLTVVYWMFDIFMSCITGYYSKEGAVIMSRKKIFWHYAKRWMVLDVGLVTMDLFLLLMEILTDGESADRGVGLARGAKLARLTRVIRLLRLMRLVKLRKIMFTIQSFVDSEWVTVLVAVLKNIGVIVALNHFLACVWFWIGNMDHGWVERNGVQKETYYIQYIVSLNWALAQFTPGASNIEAETILERTFLAAVLISGMVVATCFVSNITSMMASVWTLNRFNSSQQVLLKKFLHQQRVSRTLASRITRYVDFILELRHTRVHASKVQFLGLLSGPLHIELQTELFEPHLRRHPCFLQVGSQSKPTMREICATASTTENYAKNDMVFHRGSEARKVQFLTLGSLVYRCKFSEHESLKMVRLEQGMWFVEPVLWMPWKHVGEMKALTEVDTVTVSANKFREIVQGTREVFLTARGYAYCFLAEMQESTASSTTRLAVTDITKDQTFMPNKNKGSATAGGIHEMCICEDVEAHIVQWDD